MGVDIKLVYGDFEYRDRYGNKKLQSSNKQIHWYVHRETEVLDKPQFFVYCTNCMKYNNPSLPESYRMPVPCYDVRCWTCQNVGGLRFEPIPIWVWISTESKQLSLEAT